MTTRLTSVTSVEMGAYAHLFAYVEEFIAPSRLISKSRNSGSSSE